MKKRTGGWTDTDSIEGEDEEDDEVQDSNEDAPEVRFGGTNVSNRVTWWSSGESGGVGSSEPTFGEGPQPG